MINMRLRDIFSITFHSEPDVKEFAVMIEREACAFESTYLPHERIGIIQGMLMKLIHHKVVKVTHVPSGFLLHFTIAFDSSTYDVQLMLTGLSYEKSYVKIADLDKGEDVYKSEFHWK